MREEFELPAQYQFRGKEVVGELHMNYLSLCLHTFTPLSCRPQVFQLDAIDAVMCEVMFDGAGLDGTKARNTVCD